MSQRAFVLAIIAIIAFVATTLFAADHVAGRIVTPVMSCPQTPSQQTAPDPFERAMTYAIFSELDTANVRELLIASRQHPELAPELRYHAFSAALERRRSLDNVASGMFKHTPLAEDPIFAPDFAALKERYQREHRKDTRPIE